MYDIKAEISKIKSARTMKQLVHAMEFANLYSKGSGTNVALNLTWINNRVDMEDVGRRNRHNKRIRIEQQRKFDSDLRHLNHFVEDKTDQVLDLAETKDYIVDRLNNTNEKLSEVDHAKDAAELNQIYPLDALPGIFNHNDTAYLLDMKVENNNPMPDVRKKLFKQANTIRNKKNQNRFYYRDGTQPSLQEMKRQVINRLLPIYDVY